MLLGTAAESRSYIRPADARAAMVSRIRAAVRAAAPMRTIRRSRARSRRCRKFRAKPLYRRHCEARPITGFHCRSGYNQGGGGRGRGAERSRTLYRGDHDGGGRSGRNARGARYRHGLGISGGSARQAGRPGRIHRDCAATRRPGARAATRLGFANVAIHTGDGYASWRNRLPSTRSSWRRGCTRSPALLDQLKVGGRLGDTRRP